MCVYTYVYVYDGLYEYSALNHPHSYTLVYACSIRISYTTHTPLHSTLPSHQTGCRAFLSAAQSTLTQPATQTHTYMHIHIHIGLGDFFAKLFSLVLPILQYTTLPSIVTILGGGALIHKSYYIAQHDSSIQPILTTRHAHTHTHLEGR